MRGGIVAGLWGLLLGFAGLVASSPSRAAELSIAAPSACPIGDELSFRTERAPGKPLKSAAAVRCTVHIVRDGAEFAARLEVQAQRVTDNPRLPLEPFDDLQTFRKIVQPGPLPLDPSQD